MKTPLFFIILLATCQMAFSQEIQPKSLATQPGIHVYAYDSMSHRSAAHYRRLSQIVLDEFNIKFSLDSICLHVVFVDEAVRDLLKDHNTTRFESKDWSGAFSEPNLIVLLGEEESDDTYMHELMHYLVKIGLLFKNVPASRVHTAINDNEALLLGSKSYLKYLKELSTNGSVTK
jgi:hypothetical protein